jgi:hypothetical protein
MKYNNQKQMKKSPKPSAELLKSAALLLMAKAHTETLCPSIEAIQYKILKDGQYQQAETGLPILRVEDAYQMSEARLEKFFDELQKSYIAAGYQLERPGDCPLLIAEELERQARDLMIKQSQELHQLFNVEDIYHSVATIREYERLTLAYLTPFVAEAGLLSEFLPKV